MRKKIIGMLVYSVILLSLNMAMGLKFVIVESDAQWLTFATVAVIFDLITLMWIAICFALEFSD